MENTPVNVTPVSEDEQGDRIREAYNEYKENPEEYSMSDIEDIFEDRDPFEFIW